MNDITISAKRIIREVIVFLVCFVLGILLNFIAIIIYKSSFTELLSSLHYVLIFSLVLYVVSIIIRLLIAPVKYLLIPKKQEKKRHNRRIRANYKPMKL